MAVRHRIVLIRWVMGYQARCTCERYASAVFTDADNAEVAGYAHMKEKNGVSSR